MEVRVGVANVSKQPNEWLPYADKSQPVWFWVIMNVKSDIASLETEKD